MSKQSRTSLANRFKNGDIPNSDDFKNMRDSFAHLDEDVASQAEAEAGVGTTFKLFSPLRIAQAFVSFWANVKGAAITFPETITFQKAPVFETAQPSSILGVDENQEVFYYGFGQDKDKVAAGNVVMEFDTIDEFDPQPDDIENNKLVRINEDGKGGLFRWKPLVYSGADEGFIFQKNNGQLVRLDDPNKGIPVEFFGAKSDFERKTVSTNGTTTVTGTGFTSADVGKVVAIKSCHIDSAYSGRVVSFNATITAVPSATTITLDAAPSETVGSTEMLIGSNNFDAIQRALDYCYANKIARLLLGDGTYYVVPARSTIAPTQGAIKGLQVQGNIEIKGIGKYSSFLKFGEEDIQTVGDTKMVYKGLYFKGNGNRTLQDFTIQGPDRLTTATDAPGYDAVYTDQVANVSMKIKLKNVDITDKLGWSLAFNSSRGGTWDIVDGVTDWYITDIEDCYFEQLKQSISYFSQDGACKELILKRFVSGWSGVQTNITLVGKASITTGTNILNINDSEFSFYDLRDQSGADDRKYDVEIDGSFNSKIASINSPTQAVLEDNAPSTFTDVDIYMEGDTPFEGHALYIHPNVTLDFDDVLIKNNGKLAMHYFSSGGQDGEVEYIKFNKVRAVDQRGDTKGFELSDDNFSGTAEINNSSIFLYGSLSPKIKANNTHFESGQFFNDIELKNCTGIVDHRGGTTAKISNHDSKGVNMQLRGASTVYAINSSKALAVNLYPNAGVYWEGGDIAQVVIQNTINPDTQPKIVFIGVSSEQPFSTLFSTAGDDTFKSKVKNFLQFINCSLNNPPSNASSNFIPGLLEIPRVSRGEVAVDFAGALTLENEYQYFNKIRFDQKFGNFSIDESIDIHSLYPYGYNTNTNLYRHHYYNLLSFKGNVEFKCLQAFSLRPGGLFRLRYSGVRKINEVVTMLFDSDSKVWFETGSTVIPKSSSIPTHDGVINEIVNNTDPTVNLGWVHKVTITDIVGETHSLAAATTTLEFDLAEIPYIGLEAQEYIDPSTLLTITVPKSGGGNEVFTAGNHGELTSTDGGTGGIRFSDGHVKLTFGATSDTGANLSVTYKYIEERVWKAINESFVGNYERTTVQTLTDSTTEDLIDFALDTDLSEGSGITYSAGEFECDIAGKYSIQWNDYYLRVAAGTDDFILQNTIKLKRDGGSYIDLFQQSDDWKDDSDKKPITAATTIYLNVGDKIKFQAYAGTAGTDTVKMQFGVGKVIFSRG